MTRRLAVPYSLARKRIRASLNKLNVYNALTWRKNRPLGTQFRQVFFAKQESRAYHGDRLTENQFKNHFRGDLPVVSPLQSGKSRSGTGEEDIPYALQTFVGLERRLDFAVFRALFASSVRQAAVFILRGSVKVNGVRIKSPGYILRPGDMFSVDPRRVLYALGRPKPSLSDSVKMTNRIIGKYNDYLDRCRKNPEKMWRQRSANRARHQVYSKRYAERAASRAERNTRNVRVEMQQAIDSITPSSVLQGILLGNYKPRAAKTDGAIAQIRSLFPAELPDVNNIIGTYYPGKSETPASATEAAPAAAESAKATTAADATKADATNAPNADAADAAAEPQTAGLPGGIKAVRDGRKIIKQFVDAEKDAVSKAYAAKIAAAGGEAYDPKWVEKLPSNIEKLGDDVDPAKVKLALPWSTTGGKLYGLADPSKSWFTPWAPRQFLAPLSILPHHIEVDFSTCHAVYLRDPVARPGHSEVISPFSLDMHERAYLWYVFRRRKNLPPLEA